MLKLVDFNILFLFIINKNNICKKEMQEVKNALNLRLNKTKLKHEKYQ